MTIQIAEINRAIFRVLTYGVVAFAVPVAGGAQNIRPGQPLVMQAPPRPQELSQIATQQFRAGYEQAGRPRIAIFWNRSFDDEVTSTYKEVTEYNEQKDDEEVESDERTVGPAGDMRLRDRTAIERVSGRRSVGDERVTSKRETLVDEVVDWEVENSFSAALGAAGARLIDRNSIMRTQGVLDDARDRANVQAIETRAVMDKTDLVVEVVQTEDDSTAAGIAFRVVVRDVRNAQVLASFVTNGVPPPPAMGYVAGESGFERARPPASGPADIGRHLATQTMLALSRRWR